MLKCFKRISAVLLCAVLLTACAPASDNGETTVETTAAVKGEIPESVSVLFLGNSFSVDTLEYAFKLLSAFGVKEIKIGKMIIGGCSINKHYENATQDLPKYDYSYFGTDGTFAYSDRRISETLTLQEWDWVFIQHGTGDGSRYANEYSYSKLEDLVKYIKETAGENTKVGFNMTWVGEPGSSPELASTFGNDQIAFFNAICQLTSTLVANTPGIDMVTPTGTGIQNARTTDIGILTRDNYHLNQVPGRYIAALTFIAALTGMDISNAKPLGGITDEQLAIAIAAAQAAVANPYQITDISK